MDTHTIITLSEAKKHLNIEESFTDDDQYIQELISVAELVVQEYLNGGIVDATLTFTVGEDTVSALPKSIKHACLLLISHLYQNRNMVSFSQGYEIPYSFKFLLSPYRNYVIK